MVMVVRAFSSILKFHKKNIEFIVDILLTNDYSAKLIFETTNIRFKKSIIFKHTLIRIDSSMRNDTTYSRTSALVFVTILSYNI